MSCSSPQGRWGAKRRSSCRVGTPCPPSVGTPNKAAMERHGGQRLPTLRRLTLTPNLSARQRAKPRNNRYALFRIQLAVPDNCPINHAESLSSISQSTKAFLMQATHASRSLSPMAYGMCRARNRGWPN